MKKNYNLGSQSQAKVNEHLVAKRKPQNRKIISVVALSCSMLSTSVLADSAPTLIGCDSNQTQATLDLVMTVSSSVEDNKPVCPLLETKNLRRLVDKFGKGSLFAYPLYPTTCLTGEVHRGGTIKIGGTTINIDSANSYSESAQRIFPVPGVEEYSLVASSDDGSLQTVAALTALHLQGSDDDGQDYTFDILANDNSLITGAGVDAEEFLIIGSKGKYKVTGRLTGRGQLSPGPGISLSLEVSGVMCISTGMGAE